MPLTEILAAAATATRLVNDLVKAAQTAKGGPLSPQEMDAIAQGKQLTEDEWASLAPQGG